MSFLPPLDDRKLLFEPSEALAQESGRCQFYFFDPRLIFQRGALKIIKLAIDNPHIEKIKQAQHLMVDV